MAKAPLEHYSAGGQGALDARPSRSDLVLYRKAVRGGYNLTPEQRAMIVSTAAEILGSEDERNALGAAKVLLACDKLDLDAEKVDRGQTAGTTNNTQINNTIDLSGLTVEQLKALAGATDK